MSSFTTSSFSGMAQLRLVGFGLVMIVRFEVFTAVTMKNGVLWDVTPCGLVRADVSEEPSASIIRVTRICELGTTLAVTSNQRTHKSHTA
jgi:hypothetical protein